MKIFKSSVRISVDFDNSVEILNGEDFSIPRRGLDAKIFENVDFVHVKFLRILYYQMWVSKCLKKICKNPHKFGLPNVPGACSIGD